MIIAFSFFFAILGLYLFLLLWMTWRHFEGPSPVRQRRRALPESGQLPYEECWTCRSRFWFEAEGEGQRQGSAESGGPVKSGAGASSG